MAEKTPNEPDIWRESLLRYAGYANEVGEAFRHILPKLVGPSYGIAFLYVAGDTFDKGKRANAEACNTTSFFCFFAFNVHSSAG